MLISNSNHDLKHYTQNAEKLRFSSAPVLCLVDNNLKGVTESLTDDNKNSSSPNNRTAIFRQVCINFFNE